MDHLTPSQMAAACDVSIDTLRYYEREGLLDSIARNESGQRRYSPEDVSWVRVLRCLRVTAMPIREMKAFAELVRLGDVAIPDRLAVLLDHREVVERKLLELEHAISVIDEKVAAYSTALSDTPEVAIEAQDATPTLDGQGVRS